MNLLHQIINRWQHIRVWRLYGILLLTKWLVSLIRLFPPDDVRHLGAWTPGISIIIPERANPKMLAECLTHLFQAAKPLTEPWEIIIVVNGNALSDYQTLINQYPEIRWLHSPQPLGFVSAIRKGVKVAKYDWVYLLNNDMTLDKAALLEILKQRAPQVFAIASQIFFPDKTRRRQETGLTDFRFENGRMQTTHRLPLEEEAPVRGTLYAGAGSSLFRRQLLLHQLNQYDPYHPFYWEDVEWGIRAWREGYEVLFCFTSKAWHRHRATISQFFTPEEVERVFQRNGIQCELHNFLTSRSIKQIMTHIRQQPIQTQNELACLKNCFALLKAHLKASRAPQRDIDLQHLHLIIQNPKSK
jgi:GT2 family glycosyltransferase